MDQIANVLANRYASNEMRAIWSAEGRIIIERDLWIAVMKGQRDLGLGISDETIAAYEAVRDNVDLESIRKREEVSHHDVKARIDEFCELAGEQQIHRGMTSRDLTENVEQLQVFRSMDLIVKKSCAALLRLAKLAHKYRDVLLVARTHNVAAQPTTLGRRLAMYGEELCYHIEKMEAIMGKYPARGLKGPVGTRVDQYTLFEGDEEKVNALERKVLAYLNIWNSFKETGQIYPRSLDLEVVEAVVQLSSAPSNFATTLRLMAGMELASEGFAKGQVGSSAMPHKMNARSCERICGFRVILNGYLTMASGLSGSQWNEGDVSCSVVRRVMLPDTFFTIDGLMDTFITVLDQMEIYLPMIEQEARRYLPFIATTTILMEATKAGAGREDGHEAIKEHAVATARELRNGTIKENDLADRLAADPRLKLSKEKIEQLIYRNRNLVGMAPEQVDHFVGEARRVGERHPEAIDYQPGAIL
ncbi:MAG: adenylosuccinate lyase [Opitutales bacterium]|nr:adenylosuccinate lyase [Opitutales bacterium]